MKLKDELELIVKKDEDISRLDNAQVKELLDIADGLLTNDRKGQARIVEARRALLSPKYVGGNAETLAIDFPEDWQDWCIIVLNHLED